MQVRTGARRESASNGEEGEGTTLPLCQAEHSGHVGRVPPHPYLVERFRELQAYLQERVANGGPTKIELESVGFLRENQWLVGPDGPDESSYERAYCKAMASVRREVGDGPYDDVSVLLTYAALAGPGWVRAVYGHADDPTRVEVVVRIERKIVYRATAWAAPTDLAGAQLEVWDALRADGRTPEEAAQAARLL